MGEPASDWARKLHLDIRRRVLTRVASGDAFLGSVYRKLGARIRRRLRATGFTELEVAHILREEFEAVARESLPHIEAQLAEAAATGNQSARALLEHLDRIAGGHADFPDALGYQPTLTLVHSLPSGSEGDSPETG